MTEIETTVKRVVIFNEELCSSDCGFSAVCYAEYGEERACTRHYPHGDGTTYNSMKGGYKRTRACIQEFGLNGEKQ